VHSLPVDDVQQVLIVLAILYIVECSWWLRGGCQRLFAEPFAAWSDVPLDSPEVDAWRVTFSNPLPWTAAYAGEPFPFAFDAEALLIPSVNSCTGKERFRTLLFDVMEEVSTSEKRVLIGGQVAGEFSSQAFAGVTASRLERIRLASPADRAHVAEQVIAEMHDVARAKGRLRDWNAAATGIRICGGLLAITALCLGPLVWAFRGSLPPSVPLGVLALTLLLWGGTALISLSMPSSVLPDGHATIGHRLIAFLSPATAMRLHDLLGRDVLVAFAPLVVALVNAKKARSEEIVSSYLRAAIHPTHLPEIEENEQMMRGHAARALTWFHDRTAFRAMEAVKAAGRDPHALLTVMAPDPDARSFCPRCARTYLQPEGRCGVCDLPLAALKVSVDSGMA
jgi:hypothetical protein